MLTRDYHLPFYEEVLEFLAGGPSSKQLAAYRPSPTAQARFSWLLEENRQRRLNPEEEQELEHYVALERMLSLAGSWSDVDTDAFVRSVREQRDNSYRPSVDL